MDNQRIAELVDALVERIETVVDWELFADDTELPVAEAIDRVANEIKAREVQD